jgi:hypothetical protein
MSNGFDNKAKVIINNNELNAIRKRYKEIKKYINSPLFAIRSIDGTEKIVSKLIEEYNQDPIDG